jgi:sensor domain CHASE-containing protein
MTAMLLCPALRRQRPLRSPLWTRLSDPREGRSGEILQALHARLENSDAQEIRAALEQLREITLLRLEGVISE